MNQLGQVFLATSGGRYRLEVAGVSGTVDDATYLPEIRSVTGPAVLKDGVLIERRDTLEAYDPTGEYELWIMSRGHQTVAVHPIFRDDGTFIVVSEDGYMTWWQGVHGGLARTPAPRPHMDNYRSGITPDGPYDTEFETRCWLFPDEEATAEQLEHCGWPSEGSGEPLPDDRGEP